MTSESRASAQESPAPERVDAVRIHREDLAGIAATMMVSAATAFVLSPPDMGYAWIRPTLFALACIGTAGGIALLVASGRGYRDMPSIVVRVWRAPPRDAFLFLLGFLVGLPLWALHTRVLLWDADSARIIASALYVQRNGFRYLIDTQENLLPHLVLGPAVTFGGIAGAKFVSVVSMQLLCGTTAYLGWKGTRSSLGALAAVLALFTFRSIPDRAVLLPMYPAMLALGLMGLFLAHRSIVRGSRHRVLYAFGGAACLVLSAEAHGLGQLFLVFPVFLILAAPLARSLPRVALLYAAIAVAFLPRALINLAEGGLTRFASYRIDFWLTQGYLVQIQADFWRLPVQTPLGEWAALVPKAIPAVFGWTGLLAVGLALIGAISGRGRFRWFAGAAVLFLLALVVYRRIPFYPRYFSQLVIACALGAGVGVARLARMSSALGATAAAVAVAGIIVLGYVNTNDIVDNVYTEQRDILGGPLPDVVEAIDDDRGVIGARAGHLTFVDPYIRTFGGQFLTEEEYVTFLTWPSDDEVIEMMRKHDIGWILINPLRRLEVRYHNTWIVPNHGTNVRHPRMVERSDQFCKVLTRGGYKLYELGPCPGGAVDPG